LKDGLKASRKWKKTLVVRIPSESPNHGRKPRVVLSPDLDIRRARQQLQDAVAATIAARTAAFDYRRIGADGETMLRWHGVVDLARHRYRMTGRSEVGPARETKPMHIVALEASLYERRGTGRWTEYRAPEGAARPRAQDDPLGFLELLRCPIVVVLAPQRAGLLVGVEASSLAVTPDPWCLRAVQLDARGRLVELTVSSVPDQRWTEAQPHTAITYDNFGTEADVEPPSRGDVGEVVDLEELLGSDD
jgi:hypothetical protein